MCLVLVIAVSIGRDGWLEELHVGELSSATPPLHLSLVQLIVLLYRCQLVLDERVA